ncbi:MAG: hypothetical protein Q8O67_16620 [Deltaproteobacteria bacterium]|nr:hypothetical protein [Deltaproteobacteria bacterium]
MLLALCAGCATVPDARAVMGPCAHARLAREFLEVPAFAGCYGVVEGPRELQRAQIVLLTSIAEDVLADEPPRYRLATLQPFVPAQTPSWEQLSATHARLLWMTGTTGVEMCLQATVSPGAGQHLKGHVVVVTDQAPFLHVAGAVTLVKQPCPG